MGEENDVVHVGNVNYVIQKVLVTRCVIMQVINPFSGTLLELLDKQVLEVTLLDGQVILVYISEPLVENRVQGNFVLVVACSADLVSSHLIRP